MRPIEENEDAGVQYRKLHTEMLKIWGEREHGRIGPQIELKVLEWLSHIWAIATRLTTE